MPEEKILGTTEAGVGLQRDSAQYTERAQAMSAPHRVPRQVGNQ